MNSSVNQNKPLIAMNKKYKTRSGLDVRVLCVDSGHKFYPVVCIVGSEICAFTKYGELFVDTRYETDLIEWNPWVDLKVDHPILVGIYKRHFCKYKDGLVYYYPHGTTSHTSDAQQQPADAAKNCTIIYPVKDGITS